MPPRKKILVIDDDRVVHTILKAEFEKAGYQAFAALDAMQGLMLAKQLKPDLIILDMLMPAGGGQSVYDRLQMMTSSFQLPILVYSTLPADEIRRTVAESEQVRILSKSAPHAELLAAVKDMLGS